MAWPGYIERGETDKSYDWVTGFEKDSGCKVSVKTAATSDEMVALMNEGGFDLVTASGDASLRLVALLDRPNSRTVDVQADFRAFTIDEDGTWVGYGLERMRRFGNLPYIGRVS